MRQPVDAPRLPSGSVSRMGDPGSGPLAPEVRIAGLDLEEILAERGIEVGQARRGVRCVQRCTREPNDTARPCPHTVGDHGLVDQSEHRHPRHPSPKSAPLTECRGSRSAHSTQNPRGEITAAGGRTRPRCAAHGPRGEPRSRPMARPWIYGFHVHTASPSSAIPALPAGLAQIPARNRSIADHSRPMTIRPMPQSTD